MKSKPFSEQTAIVTGGGSGIGRAFVAKLVEMGVKNIVIASRDQPKLDAVAIELNSAAGIDCVKAIACDIRERDQVTELIRRVHSEFGSIDILINNSGLAVPERITEITDAGWDQVIDTNLRAAMWLIQLTLPHMLQQDFGDIVNVASQAGKNGYADVPSYCASKHGLLGLVDAVRDEVNRRRANVRVVSLCPSLVDVESDPSGIAKQGFIHVRNMAKTLEFVLTLDREIVLHDIGIMGR